jgi:hypothetical protein
LPRCPNFRGRFVNVLAITRIAMIVLAHVPSDEASNIALAVETLQ